MDLLRFKKRVTKKIKLLLSHLLAPYLCFLCFPQESELIESVEEEGKEDSADSLLSEEKPKIQVSQYSYHALRTSPFAKSRPLW